MTVLISIDSLHALAPPDIAKMFTDGTIPRGLGVWRLGNELKPADLYCYLYAKFGPANGIQNLLRADDSDNLVHWEWTLGDGQRIMSLQGHNMRTEVHLMGDWDFPNCDKQQFVDHLKRDFARLGKAMAKVRADLEDWDIYLNPYHQLRTSITQLKTDLDALSIVPDSDKIDNPESGAAFETFGKQWREVADRYTRAAGLSMALRTMAPILAESYVNMLIFSLCRPDIKNNERLYEAFIRSNIDIKVQSLHINCLWFDKPVDWASPECKQYNSVINDRNDLLHGNVALAKLKMSEVYFKGTVPIFKEYKNFWEQSLGVSIKASGLSSVSDSLASVDSFIAYVRSCLDPKISKEMDLSMARRDFGLNKKTKRLGILFPDYISDFDTMAVLPNSAHTGKPKQ